jgi:hypothetical protein
MVQPYSRRFAYLCHYPLAPAERGVLHERVRARKAARRARAQAEPDDAMVGSRASVRAAAELSGLAVVEVLKAALDGRVRSERRRGETTVARSDVIRLAQGGTST